MRSVARAAREASIRSSSSSAVVAVGTALLLVACSAPASPGDEPHDVSAVSAVSAKERLRSRGVAATRVDATTALLDVDGIQIRTRGGGELASSPLGVAQRVPLDGGRASIALDLPPGARLVRPDGYDRVVDVVDARGVARARVRADDPALLLTVDGSILEIAWHGGALPVSVLVDWTSTGAPLAIRTRHTATLLPTGDVLFAGGLAPLTATATTEIFDSTSGRFRAGPTMIQPRADHTATLRDDGRLLVAGGTGLTPEVHASTEWFDPLTSTFTSGPSLVEARAGHSAVRLLDGRTLFVGGAGTTAEVLDATGSLFSAVASSSAESMGAAALLPDGRVAVVSSPFQIFDPQTDAFTDGPVSSPGGGVTATQIPTGELVVMGLCPDGGCSFGGAPQPQEYGVLSADAQLFFTAPSPGVRADASASLLPSGEVLFTGGYDFGSFAVKATSSVSAYGAFPPDLVSVDEMGAVRVTHTATLLPSGSTLVVGSAASVDLFLPREVRPPPVPTAIGPLDHPRADPAVVTLLDGSPIVVGGSAYGVCSADGERLLSMQTFPSMHVPRANHTLTLLQDGRVLAVGGECGSLVAAEIYDPKSDTWTFTADTPLAGRRSHTATLMFDGRVIVAGGFDATGTPIATTEIFDPSTGTFTAGPSDPSVAAEHGASILPSGRVLFVVADRAGIFDPATDQFARSVATGAAYEAPTATLLPSGKVLIAGKLTPNGTVYDDATETFSFTGPIAHSLDHQQAILLPSGRVALMGGLTPPTEVVGDDTVQIFDPLAEGGLGGFIITRPLLSGAVGNHRLLLGPYGDVLVIGGETCQSAFCPVYDFDTFGTWHEPSDSSITTPNLQPIPAEVATPGADVLVSGQNFRGLAGSSGSARASDGGFPIAVWQSSLYGGRVAGSLRDVTASGATWRVPSTPFRGPGVLRVSTNALLSQAVPVIIDAAASGHACSGAHECASGFCADGFCCDTACEGSCEACSGAKNGTGVDGVCAAIPPGFDVEDACVTGKGAACASDAECATGHCVDGVCCESECGQQCEACNVLGSFGDCTAVAGAPHGDRAACTVAIDTCDNAVCDGTHRDACEGVVGPCAPYACDVSACASTCDPAVGPGPGSGCAEGFRCTKEGTCVPRQATCEGHLSTSRDGEIVDCAPYNCQTDGTCRVACGSVLDCADPFVCDPSGHCVAAAADTVDEGCSVGALDDDRGPPVMALFAGALAFATGLRIRARSGGRRRPRG